ncbi:MAG TPA: hypothetical protein VGL66_01310 [Caulobacteraceae bacterium]|jgi:hypothetical protein
MRGIAVAAALALGLGACTSMVIPLYVVPLGRPGATFQDFMNDRMACLQAASHRVAAAGATGRRTTIVEEPSASLYINCMYAKGWTRQKGGYVPPAAVPMQP